LLQLLHLAIVVGFPICVVISLGCVWLVVAVIHHSPWLCHCLPWLHHGCCHCFISPLWLVVAVATIVMVAFVIVGLGVGCGS